MRPATSHDAPTIATHRYPTEPNGPDHSIYADWVAQAITNGTYLGFLHEVNGTVIAGAGLTLLHWGPTRGHPNPWHARIVNVWTHPHHRRAGHAHTLVTACLHAARTRGITRLHLSTTPAARSLYARLGFEPALTELTLTDP